MEARPIGKYVTPGFIGMFALPAAVVGDSVTGVLRVFPAVHRRRMKDQFGNNVLPLTTLSVSAIDRAVMHIWSGPKGGWIACLPVVVMTVGGGPRSTVRRYSAAALWSDIEGPLCYDNWR
jgi:hypothetical protein